MYCHAFSKKCTKERGRVVQRDCQGLCSYDSQTFRNIWIVSLSNLFQTRIVFKINKTKNALPLAIQDGTSSDAATISWPCQTALQHCGSCRCRCRTKRSSKNLHGRPRLRMYRLALTSPADMETTCCSHNAHVLIMLGLLLFPRHLCLFFRIPGPNLTHMTSMAMHISPPVKAANCCSTSC